MIKQYNFIGRIKASSSDPDAQTREFTELASKGFMLKPLSYYQNELNKLSLKVYTPEQFALEKPTEEVIQQELEDIANHMYYKLYGSNNSKVVKFIADNQRIALEQREKGWNEVKDFFEMIEADKEATENEKFQQEYDKEYKKQEDFIVGNSEYVEVALNKIFANDIKLPFDAYITIDYKKDSQKAFVNVEIPTYLDIPTLKTNVSATYGRVSLKNKLIREQDDERTRCIIGLTYYIASLVFSTTANIVNVDIAIWEKGKANGLIWALLSRSQITNPKRFAPLVDIYNWNYVSNIKLVRGGTHIEPTPANMFNTQIATRRY